MTPHERGIEAVANVISERVTRTPAPPGTRNIANDEERELAAAIIAAYLAESADPIEAEVAAAAKSYTEAAVAFAEAEATYIEVASITPGSHGVQIEAERAHRRVNETREAFLRERSERAGRTR